MTTGLHGRGLRLAAGDRLLVDALDLHVLPGQVWCVLGPNGGGKSTLLRTLAGLRDAQGGQLLLDDRPLHAWRPRELARRRGYLPQTVVDAFTLPVRDALQAARHPSLPWWAWGDAGDAAVEEALALFELDGLAHRDINSLSGGERQRVNIAALFAQDASLLLLDEPLGALDLHYQMKVLHILETAAAQGRAVVYSVHDVNLAARHATHAVLLDGHGRAWAGAVADVLTAPQLSHAFHHPIRVLALEGHAFFVASTIETPLP
jgi:iron complex transport system ATP-binding protein